MKLQYHLTGTKSGTGRLVLSNYIGSPDKYRGLPIATSLEGCTHRLADVGNRVHTRNDSDEDVRGYACKQSIAWKALPWSSHYVARSHTLSRSC